MIDNWESVSYSVCVIMPPRELWAPFVEIKKNHMNPRIKRPPYPHITLCAPFVHPKYYVEAKAKIREALKGIEPFEINFLSYYIIFSIIINIFYEFFWGEWLYSTLIY